MAILADQNDRIIIQERNDGCCTRMMYHERGGFEIVVESDRLTGQNNVVYSEQCFFFPNQRHGVHRFLSVGVTDIERTKSVNRTDSSRPPVYYNHVDERTFEIDYFSPEEHSLLFQFGDGHIAAPVILRKNGESLGF